MKQRDLPLREMRAEGERLADALRTRDELLERGLLNVRDAEEAHKVLVKLARKFRDPSSVLKQVNDHRLSYASWLKALGLGTEGPSFSGEKNLIKSVKKLNDLIKNEQVRRLEGLEANSDAGYEALKEKVLKGLDIAPGRLKSLNVNGFLFDLGFTASHVEERGEKALEDWLEKHPRGLKLAAILGELQQ